MKYEISFGAIVFIRISQLYYLLLHYLGANWGFVKGNVELNEQGKETVLRELEEETGILDPKFIEGFEERITYKYIRNGQPIYKEVLFFLIETQTKKIPLSYEHSEYL